MVEVAQTVRPHSHVLGCRRWALVALVAVTGCMSQSSKSDVPETAGKVNQRLQTAATVAMQPGVLAPSGATLAVRRSGGTVEIEVQSPAGFSPHAFDPVLRVGGAEFRNYRFSPTVGEFGVVFTLSSAEFDSLADGAPITVGFGPNVSAAKVYGTLNKGAMVP